MIETPLISVIIPVYNVVEYLSGCIDSVVNQTYKNLEIILVDDGSTDGSAQMCEEWALKDNRITVIHKTNGGLSDARNAGIAAATGEYIEFIDSDDTVSKKITEHLLSIVEENNTEIGICDPVHCYPDTSYQYQEAHSVKVLTVEDALCEMMYQKSFLVSAWGKLFKRFLFNDVKFPVGMLFEDSAIMYRLFEKVNLVVYSDAKFYGYLHRDNSITTKKFTRRDCDILQICQEQVKFAKNYSSKVYNAALAYQIAGAFRVYLNAPSGSEFKSDLQVCENLIRKNGIKVLFNKNTRKKTKGALALFYISPKLLRMVYQKIDRWK